jgi:3-hydroxyacyl-[acyl-carrier-protein] dehydratase
MKFRLVDKITSWAPWEHITGIKAVSFEEYSLKEAFGEEPRLPELLLLESFLQLGNWLIMLSSDFRQMGSVARISEVRFHGCLAPGEMLQHEVRLTRRREDGFELAGEGHVRGRRVISGMGCLAAPVPLADYLDSEDLRVLFSEIYEPGTLAAEPPAV